MANHTCKPHRERRGAALLLCMIFTAAVITPLTILSLRAVGHVRHAAYGALAASALSTAEGALAVAEARLRAGQSGAVGFTGEVTWNESGHPRLPGFESPGVTLQTLPGTPPVEWFTVCTTRPDLPPGYVILYAFARAGSVERCIEAILRRATSSSCERVTWRERSPEPAGA